ncbi:retrovirus-related pol polyprotein from transposon TNT 1-94 [Tanacetum coccineum]|uniref:Retrovirus-related pol polyprotein from transposon TNT 1-94 n=1 Tax=Tanacetum coccineum TaxID=301880 RepID=A0ABQ4XKT4_9ASTR
MDLCAPIRVSSINGRKYILVILDDYFWFTWVKFLRSKDEVPEFEINFLKMIQVCLNVTVRNIRTDNGTEFVNQTLKAYYEEVRISHQTSVAHSTTEWYCQKMEPFFSRSCLNHVDLFKGSVISLGRGSRDNFEDLGKLKLKVDIGIFVGYAPAKKAFRIYNKRTYLIIETIHVDFDELSAIASKQFSSGPEPKLLTPGTISSGLMLNIPSLTPYVPPTKND